MPNTCDGCTVCCKVMAVLELLKSAHVWCDHCDKSVGCQIYDTRPRSCKDFECLFIATDMSENLRPSTSKVVLVPSTDGESIVAHCDLAYPDAYRTGAMGVFLKNFVDKGIVIFVVVGDLRTVLYRGSAMKNKDLLVQIQSI